MILVKYMLLCSRSPSIVESLEILSTQICVIGFVRTYSRSRRYLHLCSRSRWYLHLCRGLVGTNICVVGLSVFTFEQQVQWVLTFVQQVLSVFTFVQQVSLVLTFVQQVSSGSRQARDHLRRKHMTELPTWGLRASLSLALMACFSTSHNLNTAEINLGRKKFYTPLNSS